PALAVRRYNDRVSHDSERAARSRRARWEKLLRERRDQLIAAGNAPIEPNRTDETSVGVADEDAQALSEMLQTLASTRNRDSARELGLIDRALRKLAEEPEEYGVCEDCGEDILDKRLEVMPFAQYCAECQAA